MARTTTEKALLVQYGATTVPLSKICKEYLGLNPDQAKRQAKARFDGKNPQLNLPAFKLGKGQKLPWLVKISDLAKIIDENHRESASVDA